MKDDTNFLFSYLLFIMLCQSLFSHKIPQILANVIRKLYLCGMRYKLKKETKPTLTTFGKYKAVAVHRQTIESRQLLREVAQRLGTAESNVLGVMLATSAVIKQHLRQGDRVRLQDLGLMKLEIESDKVDAPETFRPKKHIRGVRLHILPESNNGTQDLYQDLTFERDK